MFDIYSDSKLNFFESKNNYGSNNDYPDIQDNYGIFKKEFHRIMASLNSA